MADRYAVTFGPWSDPATWDGGTNVPDAADTVYAGGQEVTIDQDVTAAALRNDHGTYPGGAFLIPTAPVGGLTVTLGSIAGSVQSVLGIHSMIAEDVTVACGTVVATDTSPSVIRVYNMGD